MAKYYNKKTVYNGIKFDSKKEADRYVVLTLLQKAGKISDLQVQVPFELIPSQKVDGLTAERPCVYYADFVYRENGKLVVEDTKGYKKGTAYDVFSIKRKLMLHIFGIRIREI
jgi:hypothetical protein